MSELAKKFLRQATFRGCRTKFICNECGETFYERRKAASRRARIRCHACGSYRVERWNKEAEVAKERADRRSLAESERILSEGNALELAHAMMGGAS